MSIRPIEFQILLTLASEERHGYGIMQEAARMTDGELRMEAGTLYRALHRMLKDGWIAESDRRVPPPSGAGRWGPRVARPGRGPRSENVDERRRYYRLTSLGRRVAAAEAERLARLVGAARANRLLTRA